MKKTVSGIVFFAAVCLATAAAYYVVMTAQVDFKIKLIFSGVILLLALIVGIYASAVTRDSKRRSIEKALGGIESKGIAIYEDGEFVFANKKYIRTEEKVGVNFFKIIKEDKEVDGFDVTVENSESGKNKFIIISVKEKVPEAEIEAEEEQETVSEEKTDENV